MDQLVLGREKPKVGLQQFVEQDGGDPTDGDGQHQKKYPAGQVKWDAEIWLTYSYCNPHHNQKLSHQLTGNGQPQNNLALHIELAALPDVDGGKC